MSVWRNGPDRYGRVSRAMHWTTVALVLALMALGLMLEPTPERFRLYPVHKVLGLAVLALTLARIVWHRVSPPPAPMGPHGRLARAVHRAFYALLILQPLAGWVGSSATGIHTLGWGLSLPAIAPASEVWDRAAFAAHTAGAIALAALIALHVAGAVSRRDGTLRRMLRGA